ncbi:MAG: hypothetical protein U0V70_00175 [Terriglobia bacterium]
MNSAPPSEITQSLARAVDGSKPNRPAPRLWLWCVGAVLLWLANWLLLFWCFGKWEERGQFGDMFGSINALFTALAFAGLIYSARLQQRQLALQQDEIAESTKTQKELLDQQIKAQQELHASLSAQQQEREVRTRKEFSDNVLRAIRYELEALRELYDANGWPGRLAAVRAGEILEARFVLTEDWFSVFKSNSAHLGSVDAEISRKIITVHAVLKGLIEEYRINNGYLDRLHQLRMDSISANGNPVVHRGLAAVAELAKQEPTRLREVQERLFTAHGGKSKGSGMNKCIFNVDGRGRR